MRAKIKTAIFTSLCLIVAPVVHVHAVQKQIPFCPNEKLTFEIKWSFIRAGQSVLEILPIETIKEVRAYHFVMTAQSSKFVDIFYKVRDRVDSFVDTGMTHSLLYMKRQLGKHPRNIMIDMNWEKRIAQYSNFGEKLDPVSITPGAFDPLSVFYAFRLYQLNENAVIKTPVTDGKRCVMGKARVIKRETIQVPHGKYDTFLVEVDMDDINSLFKKSKNAKLSIWVTADDSRIPVQIKSKVSIGSFIAQLVSHEEGTP